MRLGGFIIVMRRRSSNSSRWLGRRSSRPRDRYSSNRRGRTSWWRSRGMIMRSLQWPMSGWSLPGHKLELLLDKLLIMHCNKLLRQHHCQLASPKIPQPRSKPSQIPPRLKQTRKMNKIAQKTLKMILLMWKKS